MTAPKTFRVPCCPECGSTNMGADAFAHWDREQGEWVLGTTYDNCTCLDCENDTDYPEWLDLTAAEIAEREARGEAAADALAAKYSAGRA